jgi:hypothetical protein
MQWRQEERGDFFILSTCVKIENHYYTDGSGSLHVTAQSKSSYLKNFNDQSSN